MSSAVNFLKLATCFEGALLVLAFLLGRVVSVNPVDSFHFNHTDLALALLGVLPLYIPYTRIHAGQPGWLGHIKRLTTGILGRMLAGCGRLALFYVACLAGVAEEIFFRGLLQTGLEQYFGVAQALLGSSVLFGLAHWITPGYALLAGLAGLYLGSTLYWTEQPNLLIPIVIHALYDYLALISIAHDCRSSTAIDPSSG